MKAAVIAALMAAAAAAPAEDSSAFGAGGGGDLFGYLVTLADCDVEVRDGSVVDSTAGAVFYLRLKGDWKPEEGLAFHIEAAYNATTGNQNPYAVLGAWGLAPDPTAFPTDDFVQSLAVDHAWGAVRVGILDLQTGKIPIGWGTGYVFNPTAKAARIPFLQTVTEETPGTLAIAPSLALRPGLALSLYAAFQDRSHKKSALSSDARWENLPFGARIQTVVGSFDLSVSGIREIFYDEASEGYLRGNHVGADFAGAVGSFGVYGEAALRLPDEAGDPWNLGNSLEACAGLDFTFDSIDLVTRAELYHQGQGTGRESAYDLARVLSGELALQAENYLFLHAERLFVSYLTASVSGLINLDDGSAAIMPRVRYEVYADFEVEVGGALHVGSRGSEFYGEYLLDGELVDVTQPSAYLRCKLSF